MTKSEKAAVIFKHLEGEGYRPEIDSDGDVRFKAEGMTLFVGISEKDDQYYRVCLPNFWSLDTPEEVARAPKANQDVTAMVKAVKIITVQDDTWCCIEAFYASVHDLIPVLTRCIRTIRGAAQEFAKAMRG